MAPRPLEISDLNETAFPTPSSERTEIVSRAQDAFWPAEPVTAPDQPPRTHEVSASFGSGIDYLGSVAADANISARVARRARALEQNQSSIWPGEQHTPPATDGETPPIVPPSVRDTWGSSSPEMRTAVGAFTSDVDVGLQGAEKETAPGRRGAAREFPILMETAGPVPVARPEVKPGKRDSATRGSARPRKADRAGPNKTGHNHQSGWSNPAYQDPDHRAPRSLGLRSGTGAQRAATGTLER
jgi:hypothetical protein